MKQKKYYGLELQTEPLHHLNNDDIFTLLSQNTEQLEHGNYLILEDKQKSISKR